MRTRRWHSICMKSQHVIGSSFIACRSCVLLSTNPYHSPISLIRNLRPQPLRLPKNPLLSLHPLLIHVVRRRHPLPLQRLEPTMIHRPHEVHNTVPWPLALVAGGWDYAVAPAAKYTVCEFHRCVAEVYYGAALFGFHPEPFARYVWFEGAGGAGGG